MSQTPHFGYRPQHPSHNVFPPQSPHPGGRVHTLVVAHVVVALGEEAATAVIVVHQNDAMHDGMRLCRYLSQREKRNPVHSGFQIPEQEQEI